MRQTRKSVIGTTAWLALAGFATLAACSGAGLPRGSMPRRDLGRAAPALAAPPAGAAASAEAAQREDLFLPERPGLLVRPVFKTGKPTADETGAVAELAAAELTLEVRELLVGPGQSAGGFELGDAGAVLEVRTGSGAALVGGERIELTTGSTFALSAGQRLDLENRGEGALELRAFVIHGR